MTPARAQRCATNNAFNPLLLAARLHGTRQLRKIVSKIVFTYKLLLVCARNELLLHISIEISDKIIVI